MTRIFLCSIMGIIVAVFVLGTPPAYAVLGIRAARTVLAARKAKQVSSSSESSPEEAYAQEKARIEKPVHTNPSAKNKSSNTLKDEETL